LHIDALTLVTRLHLLVPLGPAEVPERCSSWAIGSISFTAAAQLLRGMTVLTAV